MRFPAPSVNQMDPSGAMATVVGPLFGCGNSNSVGLPSMVNCPTTSRNTTNKPNELRRAIVRSYPIISRRIAHDPRLTVRRITPVLTLRWVPHLWCSQWDLHHRGPLAGKVRVAEPIRNIDLAHEMIRLTRVNR